jgi:hypothetical protein
MTVKWGNTNRKEPGMAAPFLMREELRGGGPEYRERPQII